MRPNIKVRYCARRLRDLPGLHVRCKGKILDNFGETSENSMENCLFAFKGGATVKSLISETFAQKRAWPACHPQPLSSTKRTVWSMLAIHGGRPRAVTENMTPTISCHHLNISQRGYAGSCEYPCIPFSETHARSTIGLTSVEYMGNTLSRQ